MQRFQDAMHREVLLKGQIQRIVSLVPSDTYNLSALGVLDKVVGRTEYCDRPTEQVLGIPTVGGTKNIDVEKIVDLQPDLILANREENSRARMSALIATKLPIYVAFPKTVAEGVAHLAKVSRMVGGGDPAIIKQGYQSVNVEYSVSGQRVFVPIWKEPYMTFSEGSYADDVLNRLGVKNAFADKRKELKQAVTMTGHPALDDRYPKVTMDEIVAAQPEVVLLPDEPFDFTEQDVRFFESLDIPAAKTKSIYLCSGKDLFWHGAWSIEGIPRINQLLQKISSN